MSCEPANHRLRNGNTRHFVADTEEGKAVLASLGIEGDYEGIGHCIVGIPDGPPPKAAPRRPGRIVWAE